jgi:ankyrin repeat protein
VHLVEVKGIDINVGDYDGRTALHLASEEGHLDIVKYLYSFLFYNTYFNPQKYTIMKVCGC